MPPRPDLVASIPDLAAYQAAAQTEEFGATGKDARELGIPLKVMFADVA